MNKYGRPLLGLHDSKPKLRLSARTRPGGLECPSRWPGFHQDDENINSQPFQRWQNRFRVRLLKPSNRPTGKPARKKGHYLNCTAATS